MDGKMKSIKAQITIFVIIAILFVALILLLFFAKREKLMEVINPSMPDINADIEKCSTEAAKNAIDIMLPQGGYLQPENYKLYKDNKVQYLCYTTLYYYPCINQNPLYIQHLESEILSYIKPRIDDCFYALRQEYEKKKYSVEMSSSNIQVNLNPKIVEINIEKKIKISKKDETREFDKFAFKLNSPIYDLAIIAQEIANQEAKFCYFEYLGFSLLYPQFIIEKTDINSDTKIYEIKDKVSGKKLIFAVRSCAFPAGM